MSKGESLENGLRLPSLHSINTCRDNWNNTNTILELEGPVGGVEKRKANHLNQLTESLEGRKGLSGVGQADIWAGLEF